MVAQRAVLPNAPKVFMGIATSERSQAPARQGHFVVTAELPEIQTVTVWTPCCVPMNTLLYKKNLNELPPVTVPVQRLCGCRGRCFRCSMQSYGDFPPVGAISIVYSYIHVQPYAISGQKCLVEMKNYPFLCTVNDTKCLRREVLKSGR